MSSLFLDSNVLIEGLSTDWGVSKGVLILCYWRVHEMILAEAVRDEVEHALLMVTLERRQADADRILSLYDKFIKRVRPQIIPYPSVAENQAVQRWIRHVHDIPVLASAVKASPEWLLTRNRLHFNQRVSDLSGLRIASPLEFFQFTHGFV